MQLVASENLFSFFYDRVQVARRLHGTEVQEGTEFYLVNLLTQFLRTRRLVSVGGARVDHQPLAIRLLECRSATTKGDRFMQLKHLADSTLYVLGFFSDSLKRSTVDLKYYAGVGECAYHDLSLLAGWKGDPVFGELADKFGDCVELLTTVKEGAPDHNDVVKLYELWATSGDERAEARLRALGVMLDEPDRSH
jgi:hypothetical protein